MIHEHELELAAAAVDFELTPAERRRLDEAIADCSICARAAASYRRDATMLAALPVIDASPTVRRQVERAAGLRPQRTSLNWVFLAAAMLGLLITSAVVIGAYNQLRRNDLSQVEPSPTPSQTATPSTSPSVPPSRPDPDVIALDPPSGELANVGQPLAHDSMALVVTDNLRIRSAPFVGDLSTKYQRFLDKGDRLFVIDGPVIAQNYEWYQVKAWRPLEPATDWPVGWVARAGHDGEVWFRSTSVACPASPMTIEALLALAPLDRVACFHNSPVDVRAVVAPGADDCDVARTGCPTGPDWLAVSGFRASISATSSISTSTSISLAVGPESNAVTDSFVGGGVVRLKGAFDDPAAAGCAPDPARSGPNGPLSPIEAALRCRTRFVVTGATTEPFPGLADAPARTVSDRLRVRSLPEISDTSIRYEPLLPLGNRLVVLDGPSLGDSYAWYHVLAPISGSDGVVNKWLTGWVAMAGLDGERWVEPTALDCPRSGEPLTLADLAAVRQRPIDGGPLACFGGSEIQVDALLTKTCAGSQAGAGASDWLLDRGGTWLDLRQGSRTLRARIDPAQPIDLPCGETLSGRYRVTGHFDDLAATGCTPAAAGLPSGTDRAVAVYRCRTSFVATATELLAAPSTIPTAPRG